MILYTIYDQNTIFQDFGYLYPQNRSREYAEMEIEGVRIQVSQGLDNDIHIERIISSNPSDYLNPKLQPGSLVKR